MYTIAAARTRRISRVSLVVGTGIIAGIFTLNATPASAGSTWDRAASTLSTAGSTWDSASTAGSPDDSTWDSPARLDDSTWD
ncbi:hypothetical protein [Nonomuraea jiangxiensis]|uniref:Uncharacterized protein n=1 Tax=Nonomuraea jiangxiensis TaxID=633440 RepID=A0A1G8IIN5_9ACTN|nr:hypothetical protein [Nonomuraea jiangxiensis]SDI18621.1 hypothetical protein SAMN05421869_104500 [Nonomuraea jiangxiensis]